MSAYSVTLHVNLHRQDQDNLCGPACLQMVREFDGTVIALLDQQALYTGALGNPFLPGECRNEECWTTCPSTLEAGLTGLINGDYLGMCMAGQDFITNTIIHSITNHRRPVVMLVDSGAHWLVVHGVRNDGVNGFILDIRDPWPPRSVTDVHDVLVDCGAEEKSAASHLLFPAGLAARFQPASPKQDNGEDSRWLGLHTALVPIAAIMNPPGTAAPGASLPAPMASVTTQDAEQAALAAFKVAATLGWPPSVDETVKASRVEIIAMDEPHRTLQHHGGTNYIVELHRDGSPGHVIAMALVAGGGSFAGQVLEMISPAQAKSWLRPATELQSFLQQSQASLQTALSTDPDLAVEQMAPVEGPAQVKKLVVEKSGAWPCSLKELAESLHWLVDVPVNDVQIDYAWSSSRDTRSPFHPHLRLKKDGHQALLMPNGRFRECREKCPADFEKQLR